MNDTVVMLLHDVVRGDLCAGRLLWCMTCLCHAANAMSFSARVVRNMTECPLVQEFIT